MMEDISTFLSLFINHVQPFAERWLTFPLVSYNLGDPNREHAGKLATATVFPPAPEANGVGACANGVLQNTSGARNR